MFEPLWTWLASWFEPVAVRKVFGGAKWSDEAETLDGTGKREGIYVGLFPHRVRGRDVFEKMHFTGDGHALTVGPSRDGKAVGVLIPGALTNTDSMFCVETKGEIAAITARRRREMGHEVYYLNPFGLNAGPPYFQGQHGFNPLKRLDPDSDTFTSEVETICSALIVSDSQESQHWAEGAKGLIGGLITEEVLRPVGNVPSLAVVRRYLTMAEDAFETTMKNIVATTDHPLVRDRLTPFTSLTNEKRSLISTGRVQTSFLSDPCIVRALEQNDYDPADYKRKKMTVFAMLPSRMVGRDRTFNRYLRVMLSATLDAMTATPKQSERPVWVLLDDCYSLGALPVVERMMSEGAAFGIALHPVIQNLGQLKQLYGNNWETFIANSAVRMWGAPKDWLTAEYLSKLLGQYTAHTQTVNARNELSIGETGRPLMRPEELMSMDSTQLIAMVRGCAQPLMMARLPYYDPRMGLQGMYDPNPFHIG